MSRQGLSSSREWFAELLTGLLIGVVCFAAAYWLVGLELGWSVTAGVVGALLGIVFAVTVMEELW